MNGRVLLIGSEDEENLSIRYLGGSLKKHDYHVEIIPCSKHEDFIKVINTVKNFGPNLIGISMGFQCMANMFFDLISEIRKSGYKGHTTVGGHFPTFEYRKIFEMQSGIDSIIRFEGEQAIVELAEYCIGKRDIERVSNLVYRNPKGIKENKCGLRFQELDSLPFPLRSKELQIRLGEKFATLVASRGCYHSSCLYCCIGAFHSKKEGRKYAIRSPENIAKEVSYLYNHGVRLFQFHDDNFMLPAKNDNLNRFNEIKESIKKESIDIDNIAFLIKARPDSINEEVVSMLKEIGVVGIFLGVENASETGLKALIRGSNTRDINNAIDILRKHEIATTFNLLIFHPNATLNEINENIYFMKSNIDCPLDFGRAEIVAGSPLERLVIQEGILQGKWPNWDYKIKDRAVEQMFRINLATFRRKGSNYSKLSHSLIALVYRAYTINRLYPGQISRKLLSETNGLVKKSNEETLKNILRMYELTANLNSSKEIDDLYEEIRNECDNSLSKAKTLTNRINRLQILERKFAENGISGFVQASGKIKTIFRI